MGHRTAPALLPEAHLALDAARQLRNCLSRAPAGTGPAAPSPSARCAAARRWTWPAALRWALPSAEVVRRGATAEGVSWLERRGCEVLRAAAIAPGKMVGCEAAQCLGPLFDLLDI